MQRYKSAEIKKNKKFILNNVFFNNLCIKYILKRTLLPLSYKQSSLLFLWKNNYFITFSKLNNVCLNTGKVRSVLINFKVSRLMLKVLISRAVINGVYKTSW